MPPRHVYAHVPFCARRCSYCDFAIAVRSRVPVDDYLRALETEMRMRYASTTGWEVDTLYFGGGTPSLLGGEGVARMIAQMRQHLTLAPDAEVTLEANPDDITPVAAAAWRSAGVNRLSIGSQTFDDRVLAWMHRLHSADRIGEAVRNARDAGIDNVSLDLIFALPESLGRDWQRDVGMALALEPDHLSLYGLTIEPATALARWRDRGEAIEAPEERYESDFLHAHDALTAAGFDHYEVSNFGRPDRWSRHNSSYWSGAPYAGLGPGAHEFDGTTRRWNHDAYVEWTRELAEGRTSVAGEEKLTASNRSAEETYLGLRTVSGLALRADEVNQAQAWVDAGWASLEVRASEVTPHGGASLAAGSLKLTPLGWLRLDSIAADLTLSRSR